MTIQIKCCCKICITFGAITIIEYNNNIGDTQLTIKQQLLNYFKSKSEQRKEVLIDFFVDEDLLYPASELNSHGPAVYGYRSSGDSKSDSHEIILKFQNPAIVCRIQILAHQYIIRKFYTLFISQHVEFI